MSRADAIARKAYDKYKETHPKASRDDIKKWATAGTGNYGMAHWEFPGTEAVIGFTLPFYQSRQISLRAQKLPEGRGALMSLPMLELMRYHLDSIDGSCLDRGHPISALLLACAAVRAIFNDTFLD